MIEKPQVVTTEPMQIASLHIETPHSEMQRVMGPGIGEAIGAAREQGVGPVGPWFAHHWSITAEGFNFDICIPVSSPVKATGRVQPAERPAMRVLRTIYQGPYEGLAQAWHEFDAWADQNGFRIATDLYECYLVGPESSGNPADWRTELSRPLV